jgi:basic membrane protein A
MKKFIGLISISAIVIVALLAVIALVTVFKAISAQASEVKVGLIINGDIIENEWNWMSIQGLLRAERELAVIGTVYTSTDPAETMTDTQQCALDANDLCIGVEFFTTDAISKTAALYPNTKFALLDGSYKNYMPNLRGVMFTREDVGYLAGTLAALMSQSDILGDLGGMEIPPVVAFTEGYSNGARCAIPDITTIISYTGDFTNPDLGAEYAQGMISHGADVVFAAAGQTGNGAILTTTQSGVWAIGVDTDQYLTLFMTGTVSGSNYLLTSAMVRLDSGVFQTISDLVSGSFTSGEVIYDLAMDGVGLAPFHDADVSIPLASRTQLDWVKRALIGGVIDPLDPEGPCLVMHKQFLPLTNR